MVPKTLYSSKWLDVREKDGYVYSHSPWCNGVGVAVLASRIIGGLPMFLGRYEITPAHSMEAKLCSITGGYDNADQYSLMECALNELREEGGYNAPKSAVTYLGTVRPYKGSDTIMHLYAVDLDSEGVETCEATGDGTKGEEGSYVEWVTGRDLIGSSDPLNHTMFIRTFIGNPPYK